MKKRVSGYGQYKDDFFNKLNFPFQRRKAILDVGCGDGSDADVFLSVFGLSAFGFDIYKAGTLPKALNFKKGSVFHIPFGRKKFDYVFSHDVLHHVDEKYQRYEKHRAALVSIRDACKRSGYVIIVEGNRYNPLFYPHMVKLRGHDHFRQSYFVRLILDVFNRDSVSFRHFEAHLYPKPLLNLFRIYEYLMEHAMPKSLLAYNIAIIKVLK